MNSLTKISKSHVRCNLLAGPNWGGLPAPVTLPIFGHLHCHPNLMNGWAGCGTHGFLGMGVERMMCLIGKPFHGPVFHTLAFCEGSRMLKFPCLSFSCFSLLSLWSYKKWLTHACTCKARELHEIHFFNVENTWKMHSWFGKTHHAHYWALMHNISVSKLPNHSQYIFMYLYGKKKKPLD